jgi:polar amino acid transport system substrate-binding protein
MGVIAYPPNSFINTKTGKWEGFTVDMGNDIASVMGVTLELTETTFGNAVLDLQANKIDFQFGLQATPLRAMSIDFAGPVYELSYSVIMNKQFNGKTWADFNKPDVKIAVITGSSSALAVRMYAPRAQRVELKEMAETILAVQAGRADALGDMAIAALVAKVRNPQHAGEGPAVLCRHAL